MKRASRRTDAPARVLVLAALLALTACTTGTSLPESARPQGAVTEGTGAELVTGDRIRYRTLTRADFKASDPPPSIAPFRERVGAATCGELVPAEGMQLMARALADGGYEARIDGLGFVALMNRRCSWWNDANTRFPESYVLEHEQIHFAIYELAARELNAGALRLAERLRGRGPTAQAAADDVSERLRVELQGALQRVLERSTRFDEDTSLSMRPDEQARWAREVEAELAR